MKIKSTLLCLALSAACVTAFAQKSKSITLADSSRVTSTNVDNSLNGPFLVKNKKGVVITRGSYKNDERVGNWYFLNSDNSVFLRYNYDLNKVLALDAKSLAFANIKVIANNEEDSKSASVPVPLMSIEQYIDLITAVVKDKIPSAIQAKNKSLKVEIIAEINEAGVAVYKAKYTADKVAKSQNFDLRNQKFTIEWIPAALNNTRLKSQFAFETEVTFDGQRPLFVKRFRWDQ